jgi:hypothetical protein
MELYRESYEEIQNILLYIDSNCLPARQMLALLQEKAQLIDNKGEGVVP